MHDCGTQPCFFLDLLPPPSGYFSCPFLAKAFLGKPRPGLSGVLTLVTDRGKQLLRQSKPQEQWLLTCKQLFPYSTLLFWRWESHCSKASLCFEPLSFLSAGAAGFFCPMAWQLFF
uniref:Uncharacterized protein n=1 Tax=Mus musculus TaxID=10090 RepID=Q8BN34_MOUSE|nr:unnamed protein product [Mus musculus]